eukprot:5439113-Ditylum_brightwellii.AAC.1
MWHRKEHSGSVTSWFCRGRAWKWCPTTGPECNMFPFYTKAIGLHMTYAILPPWGRAWKQCPTTGPKCNMFPFIPRL